jgi:hypothetical protein
MHLMKIENATNWPQEPVIGRYHKQVKPTSQHHDDHFLCICVGKYSFVSRTIQDWVQLPPEVLRTLPCKPNTLKKKVRKVIIEVSQRKINCAENH